MSIEAILMPMFAQVALTFVLLFWMSVLRLRAVRSGAVQPAADRAARAQLAAAGHPDLQRLP